MSDLSGVLVAGASTGVQAWALAFCSQWHLGDASGGLNQNPIQGPLAHILNAHLVMVETMHGKGMCRNGSADGSRVLAVCLLSGALGPQ